MTDKCDDSTLKDGFIAIVTGPQRAEQLIGTVGNSKLASIEVGKISAEISRVLTKFRIFRQHVRPVDALPVILTSVIPRAIAV